MALYRITIKLHSSVITPLKGDTVWGHVVWGIANHEGDSAVSAFLAEAKKTPESFAVSSAFPYGFICTPLPVPQERKEALTIKSYSDIKKNKKLKYIPASEFIDGVETIAREKGTSPYSSVSVMHNTINRFSSTVNEGLFSVSENWYESEKNEAPKLDIYVASSYEEQRVKQLMEWAFENGFGADSSTGKGWIEVFSVEKVAPKFKDSGVYVSLSPFVESDEDKIEDLRADLFVRNGKTGNGISNTPWKKTVVLYDEGAVIKASIGKSVIGKLLENIHADPRICQSGFAPVIPIKVEE